MVGWLVKVLGISSHIHLVWQGEVEVELEVYHTEQSTLHSKQPLLELFLLFILDWGLWTFHVLMLEPVVCYAVALYSGPIVHDFRCNIQGCTTQQLSLVFQVRLLQVE